MKPRLKLSFSHFLLKPLAVVVQAALGAEVQKTVEGHKAMSG
jgi:hypothetical protein